MDDTSGEIALKMLELMRQKTGWERFQMGCAMRGSAKHLMELAILQKTPAASPADIRREIFLRFYGNDFDAPAREKIIALLDKVADRGHDQATAP